MEDWVPLGKASKLGPMRSVGVEAGISRDHREVYVYFQGGFGDIRLVLDPDDAENLGRLLLGNAQDCLDPDDPVDAGRLSRCPHCLAKR